MGKTQRKLTEWQILIKKVMEENPKIKFKDALKMAKKMYKPKNKTMKKGGTCGNSILGGDDDTETEKMETPVENTETESSSENLESENAGGGIIKDVVNIVPKVHSKLYLKQSVNEVGNAVKNVIGMKKKGGKKTKKRTGGKGGSTMIENTKGGTPYFVSK
jgi:hypothetical protein